MEAEKTGIKIVESPFVVSFRDMTKYFKPGLPFDFTVRLLPLAQPLLVCPLVDSVKSSLPKWLFVAGPGEPPRWLPGQQRPGQDKSSGHAPAGLR